MAINLTIKDVNQKKMVILQSFLDSKKRLPYFNNGMEINTDNYYDLGEIDVSFADLKLAEEFKKEFYKIKTEEKFNFEFTPKLLLTVLSPLDTNKGSASSPNMHNKVIVSV